MADHPEDRCGRCGGPNPTAWSAPSPLWNQVMRGGSINGGEEYGGVVCPTCFALLAQEHGIASGWWLTAKTVLVGLEIVTPSGRVWDDDTRMWTTPPDVACRSRAAPVGAGVSECVWCERDCPRCGFPISGGWEHVDQPQPEASSIIMCKAHKVAGGLVEMLTGYFQHQQHKSVAP